MQIQDRTTAMQKKKLCIKYGRKKQEKRQNLNKRD